MKRTNPATRLFTRCVATLALTSLVLAACSDDSSSSTTTLPPQPRITVTSFKDDPASQLLAEIYARLLEDAGFRVSRRDPVDMDLAGAFEAVADGSIGVIPVWSGDLVHYLYSQTDAPTSTTTPEPTGPASTLAPVTIPTTTLPPDTTTGDTTEDTTVDTTTGDTGADTTTGDTTEDTTTTTTPPSNGRGVLEQVVAIQTVIGDRAVIDTGMLAENKTVVACLPATFDALADVQLTSLTDLASNAPRIRLGATEEWQNDEAAGMPALLRFYGGEFKDVVTVDDPGAAAVAGDADCLAINSMDPAITSERMTILADPVPVFPGNAALALASVEVGTPDMLAVIDSVASSLTTEQLNKMVRQIVENGADPAVLANIFVDSL
ncbi:MAG: hypothetical protein M9961_01280 [Ilumatobacteraceae bacterium]|nr:hypothetical protein [Ilumatobacteraceae bacterium]